MNWRRGFKSFLFFVVLVLVIVAVFLLVNFRLTQPVENEPWIKRVFLVYPVRSLISIVLGSLIVLYAWRFFKWLVGNFRLVWQVWPILRHFFKREYWAERLRIVCPPKWETPRDPREVGSICDIWNNRYPTKLRKHELGIGISRNLTVAEKLFMTLLLICTYFSVGYVVRGYFVKRTWDSEFIELYVFARLVLLLLVLRFHTALPPGLFVPCVVFLVITGAFLFPLRIVFVDRYGRRLDGRPWAPRSFNRSLVFVFLNYCELIIGFAYMYLHLELVRHSDCANPITTVLDALYFSVVTITTLGYGDMRPISFLGRSFAALEPIMGIVLLAVVVGLFFVELGRRRES